MLRHMKLSPASMLYTRLFGGSCVSEREILISIGELSLWSIDILHQSYPKMLNALGITQQQHNGYTKIIDIYKSSRGQFNSTGKMSCCLPATWRFAYNNDGKLWKTNLLNNYFQNRPSSRKNFVRVTLGVNLPRIITIISFL